MTHVVCFSLFTIFILFFFLSIGSFLPMTMAGDYQNRFGRGKSNKSTSSPKLSPSAGVTAAAGLEIIE